MIAISGIDETVLTFARTICADESTDCDACMTFELDVTDAHGEGKRQITSVPEQMFLLAWLHTMDHTDQLYLHPQYPIGGYFTDFYVSPLDYFVNFSNYRWPHSTLEKINQIAPRYAIEIDGFEWHDKTPAQAERDKRRERAIQLEGYTVVRFAAREVLQDPFKCVREIRLDRIHKDIQFIFNKLTLA